jgi:DNA-binding SARP family transcriptional activator
VSANHPNRREGRPVIRLFGTLEIEDGPRTLGARDLGGARPKQVLEMLLAARGHRVSTDRLADLLWGEQQPQDPSGSLQTFVSVLRRRLAPDRDWARELVITETEAYRFDTDRVGLDLDCFDQLLERSAHEPTHTARRSLEQALALVRGDVLEDEPYALWAQELRGTYLGRVLGAHLEAADAALADLDYGAALTHAEAAVALDHFSERAERTAMLALYALGRQHDALETYRPARSKRRSSGSRRFRRCCRGRFAPRNGTPPRGRSSCWVARASLRRSSVPRSGRSPARSHSSSSRVKRALASPACSTSSW